MDIDEIPRDSTDAPMIQERRSGTFGTGIKYFKYSYSFSLLLFSVVIVMASLFQQQTTATANMGFPPVAAFLIFWFLICWLGVMEGGQGALVGLQMIDKALYSESHPVALKNTSLVHKGDNMERFIVGRQFLTVIVIFIINMMASAIPGASVLNLPNALNELFLATGIALILTTIMLGQLAAQVNASNCMLDFINNYFMLFTVYLSFLIEFTGLLHSVYLIQVFFSRISGVPIEFNEPPRTTAQTIFFCVRILLSCVVLSFAFAVTLTAIFASKTEMWDIVPPIASVVVFFFLMAFVGTMEGMRIALFAVVNLPEEDLKQHAIARKVCQLTFSDQNIQAFLIGRQICVTLCMFIVARVTTLDYEQGDKNLWGLPDGVQAFFNTGLMGALISTLVGSLAWRIVASSFPIEFLSNPLIYVILRLCLVLEASGLCSAAWILALVLRKVAKFQPDETYVGKAEERESRYHEFDDGDKLGQEPAFPAKRGRSCRGSNFSSSEMALYLLSHTLFADDEIAESLVNNAEDSLSKSFRMSIQDPATLI
jgi:hypothetical protein